MDPHTWELKQLKHSIRWTIYVPQSMKEDLQRRASTRGENPSVLVQEALVRWLAEESQTRDVVNRAFHEFFERRHYLPQEMPWLGSLR